MRTACRTRTAHFDLICIRVVITTIQTAADRLRLASFSGAIFSELPARCRARLWAVRDDLRVHRHGDAGGHLRLQGRREAQAIVRTASMRRPPQHKGPFLTSLTPPDPRHAGPRRWSLAPGGRCRSCTTSPATRTWSSLWRAAATARPSSSFPAPPCPSRQRLLPACTYHIQCCSRRCRDWR